MNINLILSIYHEPTSPSNYFNQVSDQVEAYNNSQTQQSAGIISSAH